MPSPRPWVCSLVLALSVTALAQDTDQDQGTQDGQDQDQRQTSPIISLPKEPESDYWKRIWNWWNNNLVDRTRITGFRNLGLHFETITGDDEAYSLSTYGGQGGQRFTDVGFLRITGNKVFGTLDFEANLQDSRFQDPQAARWKLKYTNGPVEIENGDIRTDLPSNNSFVRLGRQLTGTSFAYTRRGLSFKAVTSKARGQARTVTIQGTNSAGPYFLQSSQIIRGSESIQVDGVDQVFGEDYTIDYEIGSITFVNRSTLQAKIISPTSTIVATYESFSFGSSGGNVDGAGARIDLGKSGTLGLTAIQQKTGSSGALSSRIESFFGYGAASTPYFLQFEPLDTQPVIIRVDGILQTEGVDFTFDSNNPSIFYFTRFIQTTSQIDVAYTPKPTTLAQGDRESFGLDYAVPLAKSRGRFNISTAYGRLTNSATPREGLARQATIAYTLPKFDIRATVRQVPDDYVGTQSTSFNRNEESNNLIANYRPTQSSSVQLSQYNSSIANIPDDPDTPISRTRFTTTGLTYSLAPESENAWPLRLELTRTNTDSTNSNSVVNKAALSTSKAFGKLTTTFSIENEAVEGTTKADILSGNARFAYVSGRKWIFGAETSVSDIRTPEDKGTGIDYTLTASYRPNDRLNTRFSYNENNADEIEGLGSFDSGFGSGFNGNGFSSGAAGTTTNAAGSGRYAQLSFDWYAADRLSLDGAFSLFRRTGLTTSNSETRAFSLGGTWDLGGGHLARGSISRSETKFVETATSSDATTADFQIAGSPAGRFSYNATATALLSGGTSQFSQDVFSYDLDLTYQLANRHIVAFSTNFGTIRGYYPQDELDSSLTYRYQVWESLAFNASYRFRDVMNLDPNLTSGQYRASGLSFTLAFNFFR